MLGQIMKGEGKASPPDDVAGTVAQPSENTARSRAPGLAVAENRVSAASMDATGDEVEDTSVESVDEDDLTITIDADAGQVPVSPAPADDKDSSVTPDLLAEKGAGQPQTVPGLVPVAKADGDAEAPQVLPAAPGKTGEPPVLRPEVLPAQAGKGADAPLVLPAADPSARTGKDQSLPATDPSTRADKDMSEKPLVLPATPGRGDEQRALRPAAPSAATVKEAEPSSDPAAPSTTKEATVPAANASKSAAPQVLAALAAAAPPLRPLTDRTPPTSNAARGTEQSAGQSSDQSSEPAAAASGRAVPAVPATPADPKAGTAAIPATPAVPAAAVDRNAPATGDQPPVDVPPVPAAQTAAVPHALSPTTLSHGAITATAQIAAQIIRRLDGRSTRFEMALTPEHLGRVDVSLDIDSSGRLAARLAFDNPAAALDMKGRVDELRRQLEEAGFHLDGDAFEFAERDRSSGEGFDRRQGRAFAAASRLTEETDSAAVVPPRWMSLSLTPDRVDVKV
ncbi:flagellar hook-length control protein FliK [uncultured Brevundimonas sp.]|uniref:flagellar hook-length control protein FliK n=1 Tax=uncultured Brevundimonas sp. TaxID=213418 RepID=UPI0030ED2CEB